MPESRTLIHILPATRWGGVEQYALDICRHFVGMGWNVVAVTRDAKAVDTLFEKEGVRLVHAPFGGMSDLGSLRSLVRILKDCADDAITIHAHGFRNAFTAIAARKLAGRAAVRVVTTRHKVKRGIDSWLFRHIYGKLDAIICVSQLAADRFVSTWRGGELPFPGKSLVVLHNSRNFSPGTWQPRPSGGPVTAMFQGPLVEGKGLETLIDALSMLRGSRLRLRIVGSGELDYVDSLRRRALARGVMDMIDWHKYVADTSELIRDCDFGVLPSLKEEAFGLSNIEFMACGRPQVCSSNGAQPEYITDGLEGFLVSPGNTAQLADTMRKLAMDPALRERMGRHAYESFVSRLSWERFADRLHDIYVGAHP